MSRQLSIRQRLKSAWDALRGQQPEVLPEGIAPLAAPSTSIITSATVAIVRDALAAHDAGDFAQSARLVRLLLRDPDLQSAQLQRVLSVLGLPFAMTPAGDDARAVALAEEASTLFPAMVPEGTARAMLRNVVMLGFFVGVVRYRYSEAHAQVIPTLEPWPCEHVYHDGGAYYAVAMEGIQRIVPGDGRWVLWTPDNPSESFDYGAVRSLAPWGLRAEHSARDASRWSETKGQGIWLASMPAFASETTEGRAYLQSVRNMGRAPVVPLPRGSTPEQSYSLELVESQSDGWQGFEFLLSTAGRKVRLAILGQDMTAVSGPDGGSYAQSRVGDGVRQDLQESDAEGMARVLREQLLTVWARLRSGDSAAAPFPVWNATPPEDLSKLATAQTQAGQAVSVWRGNGADVDVDAMAARYGVPLRTPTPAAAKAATRTAYGVREKRTRT